MSSSTVSYCNRPALSKFISLYSPDFSVCHAPQSVTVTGLPSLSSYLSIPQTSRYVELHSQLQDLKDQAAIAKSNGATEQHKKLSKQLRELHLGKLTILKLMK